MYSHRTEKDRIDVVDLDPYGTAAPFIDGAVQSVSDGGECYTQSLEISLLNSSLAFRPTVHHLH